MTTAQAPRTGKTYIVSGTVQQAARWARRNGLQRRDFQFVHGPDSILGISSGRVVWVGTFYDRPDFDEICRLVDGLVAMGTVTVDRRKITNGKTRPETKGRDNPETGTDTGTAGLAGE